MPVIVDNNFSKDTYGMRTERLIALQGNFASIQPGLNAPAETAAWVADCKDVYTDLLAVSNVEKNESESATLEVEEFEELMEEEYQNARSLVKAIFVDYPKLYEQFDFESIFPVSRNDKYNRVKSILTTYQRFVTNSIIPNLPAAVMTRLSNSIVGFDAALVKQDKERGEAGLAKAALSQRFEADTKMLNNLKSWWFAMMGKKDPRVTWVGMVNPGTGGNSGPVPAAPTNLSVNIETMVFSWDPILEGDVSSYILQSSIAGIEWQTIYSGTDNFVMYVPPETGLKMYRALGRNQNGIGVASAAIYYNYQGLAAPDYVSASIVDPITGEVALNWGEVSEATEYKLYVSSVSIGAAAGLYVLVGQYAVATHTGIFALSQRHYFYVQATTIDKVSLPSDAVFVEL